MYGVVSIAIRRAFRRGGNLCWFQGAVIDPQAGELVEDLVGWGRGPVPADVQLAPPGHGDGRAGGGKARGVVRMTTSPGRRQAVATSLIGPLLTEAADREWRAP